MRSQCRLLYVLMVLAAPALAETPVLKPALGREDPNRVICRREQITGSLAQTRKVCMTRADWAAQTRGSRELGERMQDQGRINSCGSATPGVC
jgi:hypothetical protein